MKKRHLVIAVAAVSLMLTGCSTNKSGVGEDADTELTSANFASEITAAQLKAKTSHVKISTGASGQKFDAEGDIEVGATAAETKVSMRMGMGAGNLDMRLVDQTFYMNLGPMSQNKFAKIDLSDPNNPLGAQFGPIVEQFDPTKLLARLKSSLKSMKKKGDPVEIDGVDAQPYEFVLDTSKIEGLEDLGGGADIPEEITYLMYVGPDNLPRRIVSDISGATVKVNYSKWGEPVDIKAPTKDQIIDQEELDKLSGKPPA